MDSVRVLIAVKEADPSGSMLADHLFLVTSTKPISTVVGRSIGRGHVEFRNGQLLVIDQNNPNDAIVFGPTSDSAVVAGPPNALRLDRLLGLAHYAPSPISIDDIDSLRPCVADHEGCFGTTQRQFVFP